MSIEPAILRVFRSKLRIVEQAIGNAFKQEVACCGLSMCHSLLELEKQCCCSLKTLSGTLGLDNGNLCRTVDLLVKDGLVERKENPRDRRSVKLTLSDKGREKTDFINSRCDQFYRNIFDLIPADKQPIIIESIDLPGRALAKCPC